MLYRVLFGKRSAVQNMGGGGVQAESIEWFLEDQAFSLSYDLVPHPHPLPHPSPVSLTTHRETEK